MCHLPSWWKRIGCSSDAPQWLVAVEFEYESGSWRWWAFLHSSRWLILSGRLEIRMDPIWMEQFRIIEGFQIQITEAIPKFCQKSGYFRKRLWSSASSIWWSDGSISNLLIRIRNSSKLGSNFPYVSTILRNAICYLFLLLRDMSYVHKQCWCRADCTRLAILQRIGGTLWALVEEWCWGFWPCWACWHAVYIPYEALSALPHSTMNVSIWKYRTRYVTLWQAATWQEQERSQQAIYKQRSCGS